MNEVAFKSIIIDIMRTNPGAVLPLGIEEGIFLIEINLMRTNLSRSASLGDRVSTTESGGNLDRTLGARLLKHSQHFHLMTNIRILLLTCKEIYIGTT